MPNTQHGDPDWQHPKEGTCYMLHNTTTLTTCQRESQPMARRSEKDPGFIRLLNHRWYIWYAQHYRIKLRRRVRPQSNHHHLQHQSNLENPTLMPLQQINQVDTIPGLHQPKCHHKYRTKRKHRTGGCSSTSNLSNSRDSVAIHTGEKKDYPGNQ